jgi:anti-sigma factor RsiW
MKPCVKNQKLMAWLVLDTLDSRRAHALREHLATCEACRRYLAEISNVIEGLALAETNSNIEASERFHQIVARRIRAARSDSIGQFLAAFFRVTLLNWHAALPVIVASVVIGVGVATWRQSPGVSSPPGPGIQTVSVSGWDNDLAPTVANYQSVANQSLDKLDALLTRQGDQALPPMPIYTASILPRANGSF